MYCINLSNRARAISFTRIILLGTPFFDLTHMAREIVVDTELLHDLYSNDNVGTKEVPRTKKLGKKWALESPPKAIKRKIKRFLRSLQESGNEMEAKCAVASLCFQASFEDDSKEADEAEQMFCQRLFRLNAIPIVLEALAKWDKSRCFVSKAVILLIKISYFEPQTLPTMAEHNGIKLLLNIGTCHQDDLDLSSDILMVLENLSQAGLEFDTQSRNKFDWMHVLTTFDCIDFVATKMQAFPDDDILLRNACGYLQNICFSASSRHKLCQRGIPYILENTIENFRTTNSRVVSQAKGALYLIDTFYQ